jgi:hypothetical protein
VFALHVLNVVIRIRDILVGSGSADLYLRPTDTDPDLDPALFVSKLQDGSKKFLIFTLHHSSQIKSHKKVTKQ